MYSNIEYKYHLHRVQGDIFLECNISKMIVLMKFMTTQDMSECRVKKTNNRSIIYIFYWIYVLPFICLVQWAFRRRKLWKIMTITWIKVTSMKIGLHENFIQPLHIPIGTIKSSFSKLKFTENSNCGLLALEIRKSREFV